MEEKKKGVAIPSNQVGNFHHSVSGPPRATKRNQSQSLQIRSVISIDLTQDEESWLEEMLSQSLQIRSVISIKV